MALWRLVLSLAILGLLGWYADENSPVNSIAELQQDPQKFIGKTVILYAGTYVDSVAGDRFRIREGNHTIWVRGAVEIRMTGLPLSLDGTLLPNNEVQLNKMQFYRNRGWIIAISLVAVALLVLFWVANLIWRKRGLEVDEHA